MSEKSRRILMIIASFVLVISMMVSMTACNETDNKDDDKTVLPTTEPGNDYTLEISGPDELVRGETVKYIVKVTECNTKDGLMGLDFSIEYNNEMLKYVGTEKVKVPADTWDVISRDDSESVRTYFCVDDNDDMDNLKLITGPDQFEIELEFKVLKDSSENKNLISLFDVTGAIDDKDISTAYGKGNVITLK